MLKIISLALAFISISVCQGSAAVYQRTHAVSQPLAHQKTYVFDTGDPADGESYQEFESGAEEPGGEEEKQDQEKNQQKVEKEYSNSEGSNKHQQNSGDRQQESRNSGSKEEQQTSGNSALTGNTNTIHRRLSQKSTRKYGKKPRVVFGGGRWRGKYPYPLYGPYFPGRGKRAQWCRLYKARLRYLMMGYHKRHLGHFIPFGIFPGLKKYKTKSTYSEDENLNKNVNVNNNVNNNHNTKKWRNNEDDSSRSTNRVDQPKHAAETCVENNKYDENKMGEEQNEYDDKAKSYNDNNQQDEHMGYNGEEEEEQNGYVDKEPYFETDEAEGLDNKN